MNLTKKRWLVLISSCLINLCIGSLYAWSVFASPMAEYLNQVNKTALTVSNLTIVFTIANSVGPITMISGGRINDRLGPKMAIFAGGILFGGGMLLSSVAGSVNFLVVSYGLGCGLGMGLVYGCTIGNSIKFFPDKRGLIGGLTTASYGISSVLIPPVANALIQKAGVTGAFKILGIIFILVICAGSFLIEKCPDNFVPEGWTPSVSTNKKEFTNKKEMAVNYDWKQMLSSPLFYVMILMLTCGAFAGLMCTSQTSSIAQKMIGLSVNSATMAVSILALFNTAGRITSGFISDKIGRINTLTIVYLIAIAGLTFLYISKDGSVTNFYIGISAIGFCFGSFMGVFPSFTADQFGPRNNSVNYGIMFIGFALAGYFGPTVMSRIYLADNSYERAFLTAMALSFAGLCLTFIYRFMKNKVKVLSFDKQSA